MTWTDFAELRSPWWSFITSSSALIRSDARSEGEPPANALDVFLDDHFPDERMARIYPNAKKT